MYFPAVVHHGGVKTVTGSCHQLDMNEENSLLIDCGLLIDTDASDRVDADTGVSFSLLAIKALVLTHVHLDHVGRIPELLAAGYKGPIICSEPSAQMLPVVLEDAFKHQFTAHKKDLDQYLALIQKRIVGLPFNMWHPLIETPELICRLRLQRAGHILGSAYVEVDLQYPIEGRDKRVVFSGDLGSSHTPMLSSPESPERADFLILESTYGDRQHVDRSLRQERLESVIDKALVDHGTILIPAFSIGRTQELLYEIEDILRRKSLINDYDTEPCNFDSAGLPINWPQLPVILDSPLASRFTRIYQEFNSYWNTTAQERLEQGRKPLGFQQLVIVDTHEKHLQVVNYLCSTGRPSIVIAGNGMCSGGRIVNYLKSMLGDCRHNVVFVGYQAKGTPGAAIQKYGVQGGHVKLEGERILIKAGVTTVSGYSAHADSNELVRFVTGITHWPEEISLVHGEMRAKVALAEKLKDEYGQQQKKLNLTIPGS